MSKSNIFRSFKSKKFKYGGYATITTAIIIILLFVINLIASTIPASLDLTADKKYTLSEQTINTLGRVEDEIIIYNVYETGQESPLSQYFMYDVDSLLNNYKKQTKHLVLEHIDPIRDPGSAGKYTDEGQNLMPGSLVVESGDKFRVISPMDMVDGRTGDFLIEQRLTAAISFVMGEDSPVIYVLGGHNETELAPYITTALELDNFIIKDLNLMSSKGVPEDASLVLVNYPKSDLIDEEVEYLSEYLENEGRALFLLEATKEKLGNFDTVLNSYGVTTNNHVIHETVRERYAGNVQFWTIPEFQDHDITSPMKDVNELFFLAAPQGIEELETRKRTLTIEPLLTSSDKAFGRSYSSKNNTFEKGEGDIDGPFNYAVAITDNNYHMVDNILKTTKLVVIGNSTFLETGLYQASNLLLNSLNWLYEREESIAVRPKSLSITPLNINEAQKRAYSILTIIVIPVVIMGAGLMVWLRRRHL